MKINNNDCDWDEFKNPPKASRPMVRWWWTGTDVEQEELLQEIKELDERGFLGVEIQVFMIGSPLDLKETDLERYKRSHRFMQPFYYEMVKCVLDEAAKRDMIVDLTIGSSWPPGSTHVNPRNSIKTLLIGKEDVVGPQAYTKQLSPHKKSLKRGVARPEKYIKDLKLVAVIAAKPIDTPGKIRFKRFSTSYIDKNSLIDLTELVGEDRILRWTVPEGQWEIFSFYSIPTGISPILDSKTSEEQHSLALDHLSSEPILAHLDLHIGKAEQYFSKRFGTTLRAIFTDSIEMTADWLWTEDFLKEFKIRRGYDLTPFLPVCFVPNRDHAYFRQTFAGDIPVFDFKGDMGKRIRYDYNRTLSELFIEKYIESITKWVEKHSLLNRIQAYGFELDLLKAYGRAHIPEAEQLYAGGTINFLKMAGSAALVYEKPITSAECLVWNQRDYMTTPLKWKVAADRLFVSGINQMIYHGFPYQHPSFPYPGFSAFSTPYVPYTMNYPSNFSRSNPFWDFFPTMNNYISRCQYILQRGTTVSNVAIFFHKYNYDDAVLKREEMIGGYLDEYDAPPAKEAHHAHVKQNLKSYDKWTRSLLKITDNLASNGYYYAYINEESLINAEIEGTYLKIGEGLFEVIIFLDLEYTTIDIAKKLESLANRGLNLVFINKLPKKQAGFLNYKQNDSIINDISSRIIQKEKVWQTKSNGNFAEWLKQKSNIKPDIKFSEEQPSILYIHRKTNHSDYYFLRHSLNTPKRVSITFFHPNKTPFVLNPWSGVIDQVPSYYHTPEGVNIELYFEPYGSTILEFKDGKEELYIQKGFVNFTRENGYLIAHISDEGNYDITLSSGEKRSFAASNNDFLKLTLNNWHLSTKLRKIDGELESIQMELEDLKDWREIPRLKYCSSKGIYTSKFILTQEWFEDDRRIILSLGRVHDVAIIAVNQTELTPLLVYPYQVDITSESKAGENLLGISVIPTIRNRLLGYGHSGHTDWINHREKKELMPSGLIGPVEIRTVKRWVVSY